MIELTANQDAVLNVIAAQEGLTAYAYGKRLGQALPDWRVYQALRGLQDRGFVVEDASGKTKPSRPTFWYIHPQHRATLGMPPLESLLSEHAMRCLTLELAEGTHERREAVKQWVKEERAKRQEPARYEKHECPHCGQVHCVPPKRQHRKSVKGAPAPRYSPELQKRLDAAKRESQR